MGSWVLLGSCVLLGYWVLIGSCVLLGSWILTGSCILLGSWVLIGSWVLTGLWVLIGSCVLSGFWVPLFRYVVYNEPFRPATLFKKRFWRRCFPVNFVKFLRTPISVEHLWWLLLDVAKKKISVKLIYFIKTK